MNLINTGPLVKYNEASTVKKEYAEFIGLKGFDLQPNADGLPTMYVEDVVKDGIFKKSDIETFVPSTLKRHKPTKGQRQGEIAGKEIIDFYEIKRMAQGILMGKKGLSEEWLGPLPDDIIHHIKPSNGEIVLVVFSNFLSHNFFCLQNVKPKERLIKYGKYMKKFTMPIKTTLTLKKLRIT